VNNKLYERTDHRIPGTNETSLRLIEIGGIQHVRLIINRIVDFQKSVKFHFDGFNSKILAQYFRNFFILIQLMLIIPILTSLLSASILKQRWMNQEVKLTKFLLGHKGGRG